MASGFKRLRKWLLGGLIATLALVAMYVVALAYPAPLFAHKQSFGEFTVFSNDPLPPDFLEAIEGARMRVAGMDHARPGERWRIFICGNRKLYGFFTSLVRKSSNSMGLGLSAFRTMYLNATQITSVVEGNHGGIEHSRFAGDYGGLIAHEIAHSNVVRALGYRRATAMPFWLNEGYAEYQSYVATTRADPDYDLRERVVFYLDDDFWGMGDSVPRRLFRWHLLAEYLAEVEGRSLNDLEDPTLDERQVEAAMITWAADQD